VTIPPAEYMRSPEGMRAAQEALDALQGWALDDVHQRVADELRACMLRHHAPTLHVARLKAYLRRRIRERRATTTPGDA
jgi:hypothetical protein